MKGKILEEGKSYRVFYRNAFGKEKDYTGYLGRIDIKKKRLIMYDNFSRMVRGSDSKWIKEENIISIEEYDPKEKGKHLKIRTL